MTSIFIKACVADIHSRVHFGANVLSCCSVDHSFTTVLLATNRQFLSALSPHIAEKCIVDDDLFWLLSDIPDSFTFVRKLQPFIYALSQEQVENREIQKKLDSAFHLANPLAWESKISKRLFQLQKVDFSSMGSANVRDSVLASLLLCREEVMIQTNNQDTRSFNKWKFSKRIFKRIMRAIDDEDDDSSSSVFSLVIDASLLPPPPIRHLDLSNTKTLTSKSLVIIAQRLYPTLEVLNLSNSTIVSSTSSNFSSSSSTDDKTSTVLDEDNAGDTSSKVSASPSAMWLDYGLVPLLKKTKCLKSLSLRENENCDENHLKILLNVQSRQTSTLQELNLSGLNFTTTAIFDIIAKSSIGSTLRHLLISHSIKSSPSSTEIDDNHNSEKLLDETVAACVESLPFLETLDISSCGNGVGDRTLASLVTNCSLLKIIDISDSSLVTESGFVRFLCEASTSLEEVVCRDCENLNSSSRLKFDKMLRKNGFFDDEHNNTDTSTSSVVSSMIEVRNRLKIFPHFGHYLANGVWHKQREEPFIAKLECGGTLFTEIVI